MHVPGIISPVTHLFSAIYRDIYIYLERERVSVYTYYITPIMTIVGAPPCRLKSGKLFTILFANLDNFYRTWRSCSLDGRNVWCASLTPRRLRWKRGKRGPWKGMGKSRDKDGCTPNSVPMLFICIYCVL